MPNAPVAAAAEGLPTARELVFQAEGDMRKVYDLALIVHDQMNGSNGIDPKMTVALSWLTAELVEIGERLQKRHEAIFQAVVRRGA